MYANVYLYGTPYFVCLGSMLPNYMYLCSGGLVLFTCYVHMLLYILELLVIYLGGDKAKLSGGWANHC